jgi:hypothetical protein
MLKSWELSTDIAWTGRKFSLRPVRKKEQFQQIQVYSYSENDNYIRNYIFCSLTGNTQPSNNCSEEKALDIGRPLTGNLPCPALLREIRKEPSYQAVNKGSKLILYRDDRTYVMIHCTEHF